MAEELHSHGVDVLGIDVDEKLLHDSDPHLTDSFIADATDPEALKQLGVKDFQQVVIGVGSSLEASILTVSNLVELGVKDIWAKADSDAHARILTRVGVHHVVCPERDTGRRVAHLLSGRFQDYTVFDQGYAMITLRAPKELVNHSLTTGTACGRSTASSWWPCTAATSGHHPLLTTISPPTTTSSSPARPPTWRSSAGANRPSPGGSDQP